MDFPKLRGVASVGCDHVLSKTIPSGLGGRSAIRSNGNFSVLVLLLKVLAYYAIKLHISYVGTT